MLIKNIRAVSFILCFALVITMSVFPMEVQAAAGNITFNDIDEDNVYFAGDSISFSFDTGAIPGLPANTPAVAELYLLSSGGSATKAAILTSSHVTSYRIPCDTTVADTVSIAGTIATGVSSYPASIGVKIFVGGSLDGTTPGTLITGATPVPLSEDGAVFATVGLDSIFSNFVTKGGITDGFYVNDAFNADQTFDLSSADVTFSMVINWADPEPDEADWIVGSMAFENLNMLDQTAMEQLASIADSIDMRKLGVPDASAKEQYEIGLDTVSISALQNFGATISLKNSNFDGYTSSDFEAAGVPGQTGTAGAISFNDGTDTLTFSVSHFSNYKISLLKSAIEKAKAIIGTTFTAVEGIDTNIIDSLSDLEGLSATGVTIASVLSKTPTDGDPIPLPVTLANGNITYNSNSHNGTVTLELETGGITDSAILTSVIIPMKDEVNPVPGNSGTITVSNIASTSLNLNWTTATDVVSSSSNLKYFIVKSNLDNIGTVSDMELNGTILNDDGTLNINTYAVSGLTSSTTYYFNIAVRDLAGKLAAYSTVSAITTTSNSGGGGGGTSTTNTINSLTAGNTVTTTTTLNGTTNSSGNTTATISGDTINSLIDQVKKTENDGKDAVVEINVGNTTQSNQVSVEIPRNSFSQIANDTQSQVSIASGLGTITFDETAVDTINGASNTGEINISIAKVDSTSLTSEVQAQVGDRPVYDFSVKAGSSEISDFGGGNVNIELPYTLKEGEDPDSVVVFYIDNSGELKTVRGAYDPLTKTVNFVTDHFSKYVIAYNEVSFQDVSEDAWYHDAVEFIAARGITTGTSENIYSPNAKLSRAQYIVMIMKAYGIEPVQNSTNNFTDAGNTYYTDYLAEAKHLGISNGDGNNNFEPNKEITRQDMFTLLYRTLDIIGELPTATSNKKLSDYSDSSQIADYAKTPMQVLVAANVVTGSDGFLSPLNSSTRAQMAQVLYNLLSN